MTDNIEHKARELARLNYLIEAGDSDQDAAEITRLRAELAERDWTAEAARLTLTEADTPPPLRSSNGAGVQHAAWMLGEVADKRITGSKAHRWLGYAQGLLVAGEYLALEEAKAANKRASDEARHDR